MKINTSRNAGFTLVEIMIVVAIIGLLAAIAIPNFVKARATSQRNACINNLRQIDSAVHSGPGIRRKDGDAVTETVPHLGRGSAATDFATARSCPQRRVLRACRTGVLALRRP
jgi:prepilin-type N-terminal cleavage/methylation domain-containing protein